MTRGPELVKALAGVNVLVVDDSAEARELLGSVLAYCGAQVVLAASAPEALAAFRRTPADVVVASVALPDEGAFRLLRDLHAEADAAEPVPVVAIAGREVAAGVLRGGFETYVRRPLDPWELCRVVAAVARRA